MDMQFGKDLGVASTAGILYKSLSLGVEYQHGLTSAQKQFGSSFLLVAGFNICNGKSIARIKCNKENDPLEQIIITQPKKGIFQKIFK